ncbi:hypothetical protein Dpoa2040_002968 [Dickeya sp. CFBP 2040]|uniref:hypothetical protein n=1 Tax=Dickeya sp. CFBP 2040 TaxID=2718531 RepID=UPI0016B8766F|nr:hypothetical protein [Dickeya sp. CFBP 2040]NKI75663.1 hypothetical protein [Dickeya sp. CFBP 2040]
MMTRLYPLAARWLTVPLWLWLLAPSAVVMVAVTIAGGVWMSAERQQRLQLEQQYREGERVIDQWREKITRMPALHVLQRWLAEQPVQEVNWPVNRIASLLDAPLRDSGVHLEAWHPLQTEEVNSVPSAWLLVFNAEYGATLNFLSRFKALPVVLRIDQITIRKVSAGLRTELRLSLPLQSETVR